MAMFILQATVEEQQWRSGHAGRDERQWAGGCEDRADGGVLGRDALFEMSPKRRLRERARTHNKTGRDSERPTREKNGGVSRCALLERGPE